MRARGIALLAAVVVLAGCSGGPSEEAAVETTQGVEPTTAEATARAPEADAPEGAVFADDDHASHKLCELWTTALDDEGDLRDVVDDVEWYATQTENDFVELNKARWGTTDPMGTDTLCRWNGYSPEPGSPSELLG